MGTAALLNVLPITSKDLTQLPHAVQRQLHDAFHLQLRYNRPQHRVTIRVTVSAATVHTLADSVTAADPPRKQSDDHGPGCACSMCPRRDTDCMHT